MVTAALFLQAIFSSDTYTRGFLQMPTMTGEAT